MVQFFLYKTSGLANGAYQLYKLWMHLYNTVRNYYLATSLRLDLKRGSPRKCPIGSIHVVSFHSRSTYRQISTLWLHDSWPLCSGRLGPSLSVTRLHPEAKIITLSGSWSVSVGINKTKQIVINIFTLFVLILIMWHHQGKWWVTHQRF